MSYHQVVEKIIALLNANHAGFEMFEHAPVRTSEEAARLRPGYTASQGAKALIVKARKDGTSRFVMLVLPGNARFNSKKARALLDSRDVSFASEAEVEKLTDGVKAGGVPPFGNLFGLEVWADRLLFDHEKIVFNAGDRSFSIGMKSADYRRIASPRICEIV